ncbi:MAG: class I SAM-dependent methyltransferase [Prevotellaceae bacterium]|jgi:SAM-dependent methyltransferase|nr:class I SAM-dependent methyltransferase [Prevotellaceae bacterium]
MNATLYSGTSTLEIMTNAKRYNAFLEKLIIKYIPNSGKILDIGAGIGTFAQKINTRGYDVYCVEPDNKQSKYIEKTGLPVSLSIEEVEDNSVDYIYSLNVLEHIENDTESLKIWTKKLKPCGKILLYVPAFNILYSSFDKSVEHYRRYRKKTLACCFTNAGLQIEKAKYADSIGFFVSLIYKWINNTGEINNKSLVFYDNVLFPISRFCDFFCSGLFGKNVYIVGKRSK